MTEAQAINTITIIAGCGKAAEFFERCVFGNDGYTLDPECGVVFIPESEIQRIITES